jgi:hypothetical protein
MLNRKILISTGESKVNVVEKPIFIRFLDSANASLGMTIFCKRSQENRIIVIPAQARIQYLLRSWIPQQSLP